MDTPRHHTPAAAARVAPLQRVVSLVDESRNILLDMDLQQATRLLASGRADAVGRIRGQFALVHQSGRTVRMARSIGRPLRYFLAKQADGPCLVVAERISEIADFLAAHGMADQFHPSYTRMVPAHHVVQIELVGCPDPNPRYDRFFTPEKDTLPADLDEIGRRYVGALANVLDAWLDVVPKREPIGVLFSGGVDSGAIFVLLHHLLLQRGEPPQRLKAFTLSVEEGGEDTRQAFDFLDALGMSLFLEVIDVPAEWVDHRAAVRIIEDYKPLDVQAAAMTIALCRGTRQRYPDWRLLVDGDGGDENLKDYPIEENPELTIRSVLNNRMLYQEGWGVDAIKHSLTYSGGQSRGHVRSAAPACWFGFLGFSPYAVPEVIEVAEGIPFVELTDWDHRRLYALKGEVVRRGVKALTGLSMPAFPKRRFQHGVAPRTLAERLVPHDERLYRRVLEDIYLEQAAG